MRCPIATLIACLSLLFTDPVMAEPLHDAARTGDLAAVRQLLGQGAEVDKGDGEDKSALYHAAAHNRPDVVQLLIDRGADPNRIRVSDQGGPVDGPIHAAVKRGNLRVIEILAGAGADLTAATIYTEAPLHVALKRKRTEVAALLRSLGAAKFAAPRVDALIADADVELGRKLANGCYTCHALEADGKPKGGYGSELGPTLWNVVGRKKGGIAGWKYSESMSKLEGVWDYKALNDLIANPTATVPGTKMWYLVSDLNSRAAIIAYLRTLSDDPVPLP